MKFYTDVHLHSRYSRATSKNLDLERLYLWARLKGIQVVGTADFVHPAWLKELKEKLVPAEEGFFRLKDEHIRTVEHEIPAACRGGKMRFMLSVEISNIYKRLGKVRKVHNVVFVPSFAAAEKLQSKLDAIGNIASDGRPILGLDSRDLLEIVLETDPLSYLIPAHIWTPWFSMLGSKGGFDAMEDCFGDLSSDPPMNWRLKQLDRCVLVSNSDAHSPPKLGREATVYDTEFSYPGIYRALSDPEDRGLVGTIEFFPEEGKYHYDGHRSCKTRMHPKETAGHKGLCPECGKPVTVGVMSRVEELADRPEGEKPPRWRPFYSLVPLPEIIADAKGVGAGSKAVGQLYRQTLARLGSEIDILRHIPLADIEAVAGPLVAAGVNKTRSGDVHIAAGYDGEYGEVRLFDPGEREKAEGQMSLFD